MEMEMEMDMETEAEAEAAFGFLEPKLDDGRWMLKRNLKGPKMGQYEPYVEKECRMGGLYGQHIVKSMEVISSPGKGFWDFSRDDLFFCRDAGWDFFDGHDWVVIETNHRKWFVAHLNPSPQLYHCSRNPFVPYRDNPKDWEDGADFIPLFNKEAHENGHMTMADVYAFMMGCPTYCADSYNSQHFAAALFYTYKPWTDPDNPQPERIIPNFQSVKDALGTKWALEMQRELRRFEDSQIRNLKGSKLVEPYLEELYQPGLLGDWFVVKRMEVMSYKLGNGEVGVGDHDWIVIETDTGKWFVAHMNPSPQLYECRSKEEAVSIGSNTFEDVRGKKNFFVEKETVDIESGETKNWTMAHVYTFMENYSVPYNLAFNNCQHFAAALFYAFKPWTDPDKPQPKRIRHPIFRKIENTLGTAAAILLQVVVVILRVIIWSFLLAVDKIYRHCPKIEEEALHWVGAILTSIILFAIDCEYKIQKDTLVADAQSPSLPQ